MKERTFQCNGLGLNYMEYTNHNPPVLMLHGATNRWQSFSPLIRDLKQDFDIFALDFRGHGSSARATSYTLLDYLEDTKQFIEKCIQQPVVIIGHSLGGMVGMLLAAYHPKMVKSLIMVDTPLTLVSLKRLSSGPVEHANWLIQGLRYSQLMTGFNLPEGLGQCDPEMLSAIVNNFEKTFELFKEKEVFSKISCPVLLIRGSLELGSLIRDQDVTKTSKWIPHLQNIKIAHAGHNPIRQDKLAVLEAIQSFLL